MDAAEHEDRETERKDRKAEKKRVRRREAGEPLTAPGISPGYPDPGRIVTEDCIRPN
jgi:hypothetical protein